VPFRIAPPPHPVLFPRIPFHTVSVFVLTPFSASTFPLVPFPYRTVFAPSPFSSAASTSYRRNRGRGTPPFSLTSHGSRATNHVPLNPIIPALTVRLRVTTTIPALTQTPGGWGARIPPSSLLFPGRWSPLADRCAQYVHTSNVLKFGRRADIFADNGKGLTPRRGELQKAGADIPFAKQRKRHRPRKTISRRLWRAFALRPRPFCRCPACCRQRRRSDGRRRRLR